MAENTFHLVVASVSESVFDGAVLSATLPGSDGEFTVLAGHEPLVTTLKEGAVRAKLPDGSVREFPVGGGVFECSGSRGVVLL